MRANVLSKGDFDRLAQSIGLRRPPLHPRDLEYSDLRDEVSPEQRERWDDTRRTYGHIYCPAYRRFALFPWLHTPSVQEDSDDDDEMPAREPAETFTPLEEHPRFIEQMRAYQQRVRMLETLVEILRDEILPSRRLTERFPALMELAMSEQRLRAARQTQTHASALLQVWGVELSVSDLPPLIPYEDGGISEAGEEIIRLSRLPQTAVLVDEDPTRLVQEGGAEEEGQEFPQATGPQVMMTVDHLDSQEETAEEETLASTPPPEMTSQEVEEFMDNLGPEQPVEEEPLSTTPRMMMEREEFMASFLRVSTPPAAASTSASTTTSQPTTEVDTTSDGENGVTAHLSRLERRPNFIYLDLDLPGPSSVTGSPQRVINEVHDSTSRLLRHRRERLRQIASES
ncbi:uncharacterized protein KY384_006201 [Bacidia gigantensis]|uniref:uncharacterized protein n=1 Tax=Bacidia gigantensis TaxID=2732470 RepID=UPI001D03B42A|nr:uncharacterized protein KY384_006201 [Bacidia gigantensis]KAG8529564.1 hypothetical protein KY384_006201 [Bacidia gigantensis]